MPDRSPFPRTKSKKGLQVQMLDDAIAIGIQHAALNCDVASVLDLPAKPDSIPFPFEGQTYHISNTYVTAFDKRVKTLTDAGMVIYLILLNLAKSDPDRKILLHPGYVPATNKISGFNTTNPEGTRHYRAAIAFLADHYSGDNGKRNGRVWGYIVGNEVDAHWHWYNVGKMSMEAFADDYARTVRHTHEAVRKASNNGRIYLSFDHFWNSRYMQGTPEQTFATYPFLKLFHQKIKSGGDIDWNIAHHPYPENLFECRTWNDKTALPTVETPRITFKNLHILTRFLEQPEMRYNGKPRRVILSEQGFHCADRPDGERDQAAAYAYAYYKVAHLSGIDAFILHRHVDHSQEGGLKLGLWRNKPGSIADPDTPRQVYDVCKNADSRDWERTFAFALPVIGIQKWKEIEEK